MNSSVSPIKKRHHYVWQHHLRAWSDGEQIACRRDGDPFYVNTRKVAVESYFYRTDPMSDAEIQLSNLLIKDMNPAAIAFHTARVEHRMMPIELEKWLRKRRVFSDKAKKMIRCMVLEGEEEFHSAIESLGSPWLDRLRKGDVNFIRNDKPYSEFMLFLMVQFFRTKRSLDRNSKVFEDAAKDFNCDVRPRILSSALSLTFAVNSCLNCLEGRNEYTAFLLEAEAGSEFITSDQPVMNLAALHLPAGVAPKRLDIYFPVSPSTALLMRPSPRRGTIKRRVTFEEVERYNRAVLHFSHEQLFATNPKLLLRYKLGSRV